MNAKDIKMIVSVALGTACLTVITFLSGSSIADGDAPGAKIAKPKLAANGVEMTLVAAEGQSFKAGDEPTFALTAVNTKDEPASVTVNVSMTSSSPRDMLSRVPRMPAKMWQQEQVVSLQPRETKVITVASKTRLTTNQVVSVWLAPVNAQPKEMAQTSVTPQVKRLPLAQPGIVAMNFSTGTGTPGAALSLLRGDSPVAGLMQAQAKSGPSLVQHN